MNTKILVCCHKESKLPNDEKYLPIHVGKAISKQDLGILGDDSDDNISLKNSSYCELTGMYWAWKNLKDVDVIGLCHYRRFFDFHHQCEAIFPVTSFPTNEYDNVDLSIPDDVLSSLDDHTVIVTSPIRYNMSLYADYCCQHVSDDFSTLLNVILEKKDKDLENAFFKVMFQNNKLRHYNMFMMKWDLFDNYCSWLFDILEKVEQRTDISNYNPVQKRIYGYMAERLLNVYIERYSLKPIEKKVIWFNDEVQLGRSKISYLVRSWMLDLGMALTAPKRLILK
jgi:hypothetical protein